MNEPDRHEGIGPIERIVVMENHDAAYRVWRDAGVRERILVHIDAHHDMWPIEDGGRIHFANFLWPALQQGIVREIFWVVPDATWKTARTRRAVLRHLKAIARSHNRPAGALHVDDEQISIVVLGKTVRALPLCHLPPLEESVLLDIDVDYLVIPRVSYGKKDTQGPVPWCWPEDLLLRLGARRLRTDLATIVYSVEGGYTPLKWKYLGDELELRLKRPDAQEPALLGMARMKEAALMAQQGDRGAAERTYQEARALLPGSAAPCYHLAHLHLDTGRTDDARFLYGQALLQDPSYRTVFNCAGRRYHAKRRYAPARKEYLRTLALDPQDAYAYYGLGLLADDAKRWTEAEALLRQALARNSTLPDAYRKLGEILGRQGRHDEAIRAYERSLKLVLTGHETLKAATHTHAPDDPPDDPGHFGIHARLARLYAATGNRAKAITAYRISIAGGQDLPLLHGRLAWLYLREHQWRAAASEAWRGVTRVPGAVGWAARHSFRRTWRALAGQ